MQAARRLYLYVMSGITLAIVASGLVLLLRVVLDPLFPDPVYGGFNNDRQQLSQAIAFLGVGTPVWGIHWWLAQRSTREGRSEAAAERGSAIRAAYFTLVLLVSLATWFFAGLSFGRWLIEQLIGSASRYDDPLGEVTLGTVAFAVWLYHGLARRRDTAAAPVVGAAAWLPRLYLYGVAVTAVFVAVATFVGVLASVISGLGSLSGEGATFRIQQAGSAAAWAALWLGHWLYAGRLVARGDRRGSEERVAKVRVAALVVIVVGMAAATIGALSDVLQATIAPLLPAPEYADPWRPLRIVATAATTAAWAAAWWWHDGALRREPAAADPLRSLHQRRLVSFGLSGVALGMGATAAGWLVGYGLDLALGGVRSGRGSFDYSGYAIANWLSIALVALPAWVWFWRAVRARRSGDAVDEAGSTIRRTYLFLVLGAALIAGLASASLILYRLVGIVIDAQLGGDAVSELSTPAGLFLAASAVALYHGLALRGDQRVIAAARAAAAPDAVVPADVVVAAADATSPAVTRRLRLVGPPGSDAEAAIAAARAALPPGFEVLDEDA